MNKSSLCYKTSRDYVLLQELLDKGYKVVCFTTYNVNRDFKNPEPYYVTDAWTAQILNVGSKYERYSIACHGITFISYVKNDPFNKHTFEELCKKNNLEFIEPTITEYNYVFKSE